MQTKTNLHLPTHLGFTRTLHVKAILLKQGYYSVKDDITSKTVWLQRFEMTNKYNVIVT